MSSLLKFFIEIGKLKESRRSGWLAYGIKNPETTADHIFRAAILAWALNKQKGLDEGKVIKATLIHHLYEPYIGDITPYGYLLPKSITQKERKKIGEILKNPPPFSLGEQKRRIAKRHQEEGKVVKKYIDDGKCCVDIEAWAKNQKDEWSMPPHISTVILPSREHGPVTSYPDPAPKLVEEVKKARPLYEMVAEGLI